MTSSRDGAEAPLLRLAGISKRFGHVPAVADVHLTLAEGECLCLLGPSGCGKSTLLRVIAGLETPDAGRIELDGRDIAGLPAHRRPVNTMFQAYALFPHLTVAGNIAYGLRRAGLPRRDVAARMSELLHLVKLEGLGERYPAQVSGGQRQRVALARALARRPRLLLLDEPLGALDRKLREATQTELKALAARLGTTMIVVTHDQDEAMVLGDRIGIMERGRLIQIGRPREVYERPATRFVAEFVGDVNLLSGTVRGRDGGRLLVASPALARPLELADGRGGIADGAAVLIALRPETLSIASGGAGDLSGTIEQVQFRGGTTTYRVRTTDGTEVRAKMSATQAPGQSAGDEVRLTFRPEAAVLLPP